MRVENQEEYLLVCVGFGPAAIAVAAALEDGVRDGSMPSSVRSRVVFLEKQAATSWQGGLLLPGTNINHSPLRDLATPRDPGSQFTFVRYLKEKGRLYEHGAWSGSVGRIEWSDYVGWAAERLRGYVRYGREVTGIDYGEAGQFVVTAGAEIYRAAQVMIACGMEPHVPDVLKTLPASLVRHADGYLYDRAELDRRIRQASAPFRVAIIGSGLSAAEVMHDVLERHDPQLVHVTSLHRGLPFRHYDMSQFSNQIYMPPEVARFSSAGFDGRRQTALRAFATNFSGVDAECAAQAWNFLYERRISGIQNAAIIDRTEIVGAEALAGGVRLALRDTMGDGGVHYLDADFVVSATGYLDTAPERLLAGLAQEIEREPDGLFAIDQNYRLKTSPRIRAPIWLNGHCEHTHGIADTQSFSIIAYKAERMLENLALAVARQDRPRAARPVAA